MLRVMMLATDLERGGLPLRLVRLAEHLRGLDVEPIVGCLRPPGFLCRRLESSGIETFACQARHARDLACLGRLAGHIRRTQPDVIHSSLFHANLAARLVGRLDRRRPIITSTVTIEIERCWHCWLEALTADRSDVHVANSEAVADHLCNELGFTPARVRVIRNGVDIATIDAAPPISRRKFGLADDVPLVAWAGRMDPVKDLDTLVAVIDRLRARMAVQAILLGDGPARPRVERLIGERRLRNVIRMALWSDDVPGWLKTADVLLFPSRTEGSPNVVIEAMLCGCPVVASDLPATRDLIQPDVHGLLQRPGDVVGFAVATEHIVTNQALRQSVRDHARRRAVERHDIRLIAPQWCQLYEDVVRQAGYAR